MGKRVRKSEANLAEVRGEGRNQRATLSTAGPGRLRLHANNKEPVSIGYSKATTPWLGDCMHRLLGKFRNRTLTSLLPDPFSEKGSLVTQCLLSDKPPLSQPSGTSPNSVTLVTLDLSALCLAFSTRSSTQATSGFIWQLPLPQSSLSLIQRPVAQFYPHRSHTTWLQLGHHQAKCLQAIPAHNFSIHYTYMHLYSGVFSRY